MHITLPGFPDLMVRDWQLTDAPSLARHANDRRIWRNLRDAFPHPYGREDADAFLAMATGKDPRTSFAIAVDGGAVGGIGLKLHTDVERVSAEIGYWIGVAHWGRGIVTAVLRAVTARAFEQFGELNRIYAVPYAWNGASARVLEKAGYRLEGRMLQSAVKDGELVDQFLYAILRGECGAE